MHTKPPAQETKIHYPQKRWNNTIIISDVPSEQKENAGKSDDKIRSRQ